MDVREDLSLSYYEEGRRYYRDEALYRMMRDFQTQTEDELVVKTRQKIAKMQKRESDYDDDEMIHLMEK